jgi:magnesium transporter
MVLSGCLLEGRNFDLQRVDVILGERFMMTLHKGPALFLTEIKSGYREDFRHHAKSPSFLVYELWDHLVHNYVDVQSRIEERVLKLQRELITNVQDRVFSEVSELDADLLHFRKVLLPARAVLADLASRKSRFISEATQPFLANMVGSVEAVLQDLLVDREVLEGSLNLYVSMVSHRTNDTMKRLTMVSVIFMPLTFLVGVYGMNFEVFPELKWQYGYLYFWVAVAVIVAGLFGFMKRKKLL